MSVLWQPCAAPGRVCLQELSAAPGRVCLQEPVLHLCVSVYKNQAHALPVGVKYIVVYNLEIVLLFVSVCFETGMLVLVVSIHVRNTETNRKNISFNSCNKQKTNETD